MYQPDALDKIVQISGIPQPSIGAPLPFVISNERALLLGYFVETVSEGWDGSNIRIVEPYSPGEPLALVEFHRSYAFFFGPPNDEAFAGHPLASRGLRPYSAAEVQNSSWIRSLERMNSVHPHHDPGSFRALKHFIFAFHDSTFECISERFDLTVLAGPVRDLWPEFREKLRW